MKILRAKRWWPLFAGICFGMVEMLSFLIVERPLGASRAYVEVCSLATHFFSQKHFLSVEYYSIYLPQFSYVAALLAGVTVGAFLSSKLSGHFYWRSVPPLWEKFYGSSRKKRWFWAFIGGILVALGGRLGQGCISGQIISGITQLSVGGFVLLLSTLTGGITTVFFIYRHKILQRAR